MCIRVDGMVAETSTPCVEIPRLSANARFPGVPAFSCLRPLNQVQDCVDEFDTEVTTA